MSIDDLRKEYDLMQQRYEKKLEYYKQVIEEKNEKIEYYKKALEDKPQISKPKKIRTPK
jgi:predicted metal-dependent peptidase